MKMDEFTHARQVNECVLISVATSGERFMHRSLRMSNIQMKEKMCLFIVGTSLQEEPLQYNQQASF